MFSPTSHPNISGQFDTFARSCPFWTSHLCQVHAGELLQASVPQQKDVDRVGCEMAVYGTTGSNGSMCLFSGLRALLPTLGFHSFYPKMGAGVRFVSLLARTTGHFAM